MKPYLLTDVYIDALLFEDIARIALDAIGDGVLAVDPQGKVIYLNAVAKAMTGWADGKALGRLVNDVFFVVDGATRHRAINPAQRAMREGQKVALSLGSVLIRRDGSDLAIEDSAIPIYDRTGQVAGAVIVFHDAKDSGSARQKILHLAHHDSLTGLPNRMLMLERLTHAIGMAKRHKKRMAVLFIDLDDFKHINDRHGHAVGDQLLCSVAQEILNCVRSTDTVSRQGGDEFIVLLTEVEAKSDAAHIASKLLVEFSNPRLIGGHLLKISPSIGISIFPEDGIDADTLLLHADSAMYNSKKYGRNTYQFFH
jgi:diguanylate cyclase (GGDEF)-like protein/PAS domain S-box-containing protein